MTDRDRKPLELAEISAVLRSAFLLSETPNNDPPPLILTPDMIVHDEDGP